MNVSETSAFVLLSGGLAVPVEALKVCWTLEAKGVRLLRDGGDLIVRPKGSITDAERAELLRWKRHVLALLDYIAPEVPM